MNLRSFAILLLMGLACSRPQSVIPNRSNAQIVDDEYRRSVALAELQRDEGVAALQSMLVALDTDSASGVQAEQQWLVMRALGRIGSRLALDTLLKQLLRPQPLTIAHAASAIGIAGALETITDEQAVAVSAYLVAALPKVAPHAAPVLEALGRIGVQESQDTIAASLRSVTEEAAVAAGLALGRHGRRGILLTDNAQVALHTAVRDDRLQVRRAAVWSMARQQLPKEPVSPADVEIIRRGALALAASLDDSDVEVRTYAMLALGKRQAWSPLPTKAVTLLQDADWRVAVEAVKAMTAGGAAAPELVDQVVDGLATRLARKRRTGDDHVDILGMRSLLPFAGRPKVAGYFQSRIRVPIGLPQQLSCVVAVGLWRAENAFPSPFPSRAHMPLNVSDLLGCGGEKMNRADRAQLLVAVVLDSVGTEVPLRAAGPTAALKLEVLRLLDDRDPAVQAAAMELADISQLVRFLAGGNPMAAGAAAQAAQALMLNETKNAKPLTDAERASLGDALTARLRKDQDVELAGTLMSVIAKTKPTLGGAACQSAVIHAAVEPARSKCLAAFGIASVPPVMTSAAFGLPAEITAPLTADLDWLIITTRGMLTIRIDAHRTPWHAAVIAHLTSKGFYNGLRFHRVVENFVVQGGDPDGTGSGGPGFTIPAEPSSMFDASSAFDTSAVGIADAGKDSGGSQWFVMHIHAAHLEGRYTHVGRVVAGQDVAASLTIGDTIISAQATTTLATR